ncbi:carbohydrate-binding module family 18 protein [Daldinia vernicosa]|uniref:carbohydrate-binding module family 18 protein n=1 Tax=Daldinia vernicosa TaxID=114800 RepID=UPI00200732C3|nr:carbohydrate-binding module family 18 protein [Daldinia vernicosa]KAI0853609.1 carbohydrate-binding module family 18 protein [Daldinia vernicosa]
MLGAKAALVTILLAATAVWSDVSPDETCGVEKAGDNNGYTCPGEKKCCSANGYCGSTDEYCLKTVGCQSKYSNATAACIDPIDGETISPDGTCGSEGAGQYGYRCPTEGGSCCSIAGYCGNTTAHCLAAEGCQSAYGECQ